MAKSPKETRPKNPKYDKYSTPKRSHYSDFLFKTVRTQPPNGYYYPNGKKR